MLMQPGETVQPRDDKPEETSWDYEPDAPSLADTKKPIKTSENISWTASEYISHEKNTGWYVMLGIGTALVTMLIYFLSGGSILSSVVVLLICISIGVLGARQPGSVQYSLESDGVHIGQKFYPYHNFKSFSLVQDEGVASIWLKPLKRFLPPVNMYYSPEDEDKIVNMLDNFLPREDREPDAIDRLSHRFRF